MPSWSERSARLPQVEAMSRHAESASALLRSLANPHRLMILCVLGEGELSVGALNERIPLSQSALSQHLSVLREEGLVSTRRESQTIYYWVQPGPALAIIQVLHSHFCGAMASPSDPQPSAHLNLEEKP
ncbi:MAG: metalloregulator ArsR/SmtB family transcription factor [Gammaproteobacteria bacterium]